MSSFQSLWNESTNSFDHRGQGIYIDVCGVVFAMLSNIKIESTQDTLFSPLSLNPTQNSLRCGPRALRFAPKNDGALFSCGVSYVRCICGCMCEYRSDGSFVRSWAAVLFSFYSMSRVQSTTCNSVHSTRYSLQQIEPPPRTCRNVVPQPKDLHRVDEGIYLYTCCNE